MKIKGLVLLPIIGVMMSLPLLSNNVHKYNEHTLSNASKVHKDNEPSTYTFRKATSLDDNRGTYLLVCETYSKVFNSALDNTNVNSNYLDVTISDHSITVTSGDILNSAIKLEKVDSNDEYKYYVKLSNGKYLTYTGTTGVIGQENNPTTSAILFSTYDLMMKPVSGSGSGTRFGYKNTDSKFAFYSGNSNVYLYRYDYSNDTSVLDKVDTYVSRLHTFKTQCNGSSMPSVTSWDDIHNDDLLDSVDVQGYLGNVTYVHNKETSGSLKDVIDMYDYVISKYKGVFTDYLKREGNPNFPNYSFTNNAITYGNMLFSTDNTLLIVLSISFVTISLTSFFVLKNKRKKERE